MTSRAERVLGFAVLLAAGCGGGNAGVGGEADAWALDSMPVLEVGALEGDSLYQLFGVRGIAELPDGSIAVANGGTHEVRIYDAAGTFVRRFGRRGGGPGEFTALTDVHALGDTVLAYDRTAARLTRFLADGTYLGDVTLRTGSAGRSPAVAGVLASGEITGWSGSGLSGTDGLVRDAVHLLRFAADGRVVDSLGTFPGDERVMRIEGTSGNITSVSIMSLPYFRRFLAVTSGDRTYAAPTDDAVIYRLDADGTADTLRWSAASLPLDDAYLEAYIEDVSAELDSAAARRQARERVLGSPRPATLPAFDQLRAGPDGELWIRRFGQPEDELREWLVLSPDGEPRATLRLHRDVDIRAVGRQRVYTLERDEYDVEYVRGYTMRR